MPNMSDNHLRTVLTRFIFPLLWVFQAAFAVQGVAGPDEAATGWRPAAIGVDRPFQGYVGPEACRGCHQKEYEAQRSTAHFRASSVASDLTILGPFEAGRDALPTRQPGRELVMSARDGGFFQDLMLRAGQRDVRLRSGRFDIVMGDVKGQTYLYWRDDLLCQLPASYVKDIDAWAYSPGFPEGVPVYDRVVEFDCVDCHATVFETVLADRVVKTDKAILGITCERCHGPGERHVRYHTEHPGAGSPFAMTAIGGLPRDDQVAVCGFCHAGAKPGSRKRPPFTFRPGDHLSDFFDPKPLDDPLTPEVHGNQLALLEQSPCFQGSDSMSCTTCHDPHGQERGRAETFVERCLNCHAGTGAHPDVAQATDLHAGCVDCHMPLVDSKLMNVPVNGKRHSFAVRSHWIGIYPERPAAGE
jgi:hypothetical protein